MSAPDLRAVDDLCRLVITARRLGCRVHLEGGDRELWQLLELAGIGGLLEPGPAAPPRVSAGMRPAVAVEARAARWTGARRAEVPLP